MDRVPKPVLAVIAPILADRHSHANITRLFTACDAGEEPASGPGSNKLNRCLGWLEQANKEAKDPFRVVGELVENIMEYNPDLLSAAGLELDKRKIEAALARYGCRYQTGGRIVPSTGAAAATKTLEGILRARDMKAITVEFERATAQLEADPPAAMTAACAILESLFKIYIQDEGLEMPGTPTAKPLWNIVSKKMGLDPKEQVDEDLKKILSGLTSVVDGLATARTHAGSAHGHGRQIYNLQVRHARLAVNAAHTLVVFLLETWDERKARIP